MKKLLLMCMTAFGIGASSQIVVSEGFESTTFPPPGWSVPVTGFLRTTAAGFPCIGTAAARRDVSSGLSPSIEYQSYASSGEPITISFQYTAKPSSGPVVVSGSIVPEYSTDGGASWKPLGNQIDLTNTVSTCTTFTANLPAGEVPKDSDFRLRIKGIHATSPSGNTSNWYLTIDDVQIMQTANCYPPTNIMASGITQNSANISWTAPSTAPANGYELYYSSSSTQPASNTTPSISGIFGTSASISSLATTTASTKYFVWVRSVCSPSDTSVWSSVGTFRTSCITASTIAEDFDSYATGNIVPDCWARIVSGTGTQSLSSATPASGTRNIYQFSSSSNNSTIVVMPQLSNINTGTHWLKFKAKISSAGSGSLEVGYVTDATSAASFVNLQTIAITNTAYDASSLRTFIIPTSVPSNARLAVRNNGSSSLGYYWDDVVWEPKPSCYFPTGVTFTNVTNSSATINWLAPVSIPANGYEYYYSTSNTSPIASTTALGSSSGTSAPISGLQPDTIYYVWVRSVCSSTDKSEWTLTYSFKTNCNSVTYINENFDTYSVASIVPACWDRIISGSGVQSITGVIPTASGNYHIGQTSSSPANSTIVVLPHLSNINAGTHRLKFKTRVASGTGSLDVGYVTDLNPSTFVNIQTVSISNTNYAAPEAIKIILIPASVPSNARLAIRNNGTSSVAHFWDDVLWEPIPSCPEPTGLTTTGASPSSVFLSWVAASTTPSNGYQVYYNTTGAPPPSGATPQITNISGTNTNVTGLASGVLYYFWIRSNCGAEQSVWLGPITGFTGNCIPTAGSNSVLYYLKTITTTAGGADLNYSATAYNAYVDNSATSFSTYPGGSLAYTMSQNTGLGTFYIWIDYNNDLDFNDAGESVAATSPQAASVNGSFTVPSTVPVGNYRARFGQTFGSTGPIPACGPAPSGSYVDYTLSVIAAPLCIPPSNISVVTSTITDTTVNANWTTPTSIPSNGYEYYISTSNTPPTATTVASGTSSTNSAIIPSLTPNTTYYLWVRSVCGSSKSWWSVGTTFKTICTGVTTLSEGLDTSGVGLILPTCWDRIVVGTATLAISGTSPASGSGNVYQYSSSATNYSIAVLPPLSNVSAGTHRLKFKVRVNTAPGSLDIGYVTDISNATSFVNIQTITINNTLYTDPTATYTIVIPNTVPANARLAIRNNGLTGANIPTYWDELVWEENTSLGTSEISKNEVKVYPNPFGGVLNISDTKDIKMVTITDIVGRTVKVISKPNKELHLADLASGMYIMTLHYEDGAIQSIKVVKK